MTPRRGKARASRTTGCGSSSPGCHPALSPDAQVALTLREMCGLTTEEIARAFLTPAPTLAQRIVRAKAKIRDARIPYQVPTQAELPDRFDAVLRVIYLVFNEGYAASSGASLTRHDLSGEAIRLGRLLVGLLPEPEAIGLLALMLLQESRRAARASLTGDLVLLEDQDRSLWNRDQIAEGLAPVRPVHPAGSALGGARRGAHRDGPLAGLDLIDAIPPSPSRSRSTGFSSDGWPSCRTETSNVILYKSLVDFGLPRTTMGCKQQSTN
jgi:hypothetical protein